VAAEAAQNHIKVCDLYGQKLLWELYLHQQQRYSCISTTGVEVALNVSKMIRLTISIVIFSAVMGK